MVTTQISIFLYVHLHFFHASKGHTLWSSFEKRWIGGWGIRQTQYSGCSHIIQVGRTSLNSGARGIALTVSAGAHRFRRLSPKIEAMDMLG